MAKVTFNAGAEPLTGRVGNLVFRKYRGQTIVSGYAAPRTPATPGQRERRSIFKEAAAYAKSVVGTTVWKEVYAPYALSRRCSVFSAAVADYMKPPVVSRIDLRAYHGTVGDPVRIFCHDEFGVVAVHVAIQDQDLVLLEEGSATVEAGMWVYRVTTAQVSGQRLTITATAQDRPGRTGNKVEIWN